MPYTFAPMPTPQSSTAEQIVNAITSLQTAINDLDSRVTAVGDVDAVRTRVTTLETTSSTHTSDLAALTTRVETLESGSGGGTEISAGRLAALGVVLMRELSTQQWRNSAGTLYADADISALRPATIYWVCDAGAEPSVGSNPYQANSSYSDLVLVRAPAA